MTYQGEIYRLIGSIIKTVQYIECNLLIRLGVDTFEELTLGQINHIIKEHNVLHKTATDELYSILHKRNDLVHTFFKRLDFEKHWDNPEFLKSQIEYLSTFFTQVTEFNNWLAALPF